MNSRIRTSLALAVTAGTLAVASTASATPIDVIGTGKNFSQTWNVINWDAKRDSGLGNAIQGIHDGINSARSGIANAASAIPGVNLNVGDPGVDANASINAFGRAYVSQRAWVLRRFLLPAQMGVHAEATATFALVVSGAGVNLTASPSYTFDAQYVEPVLCTNGCAPYFHASLLVRQPTSANYTAAFDYTQATALNDSRSYGTGYYPSLPAFDLGFVQLSQYFWNDFGVTAAYSLSTTGGNIDLSGTASSFFMSTGGKTVSAGPLTGVASAAVSFQPLGWYGGHPATFHARASINAFSGQGAALCASASGSLAAAEVGKYDAAGNLIVLSPGSVIGSFGGRKQGDGINVSQSITPPATCIPL